MAGKRVRVLFQQRLIGALQRDQPAVGAGQDQLQPLLAAFCCDYLRRDRERLADFCQRPRQQRPSASDLIWAGALDGCGPRRQFLWALGGLQYADDALVEAPDVPAELPELTEREALGWDYEVLGLSPDDHPLRLWRARLRDGGVLSGQRGGQPG